MFFRLIAIALLLTSCTAHAATQEAIVHGPATAPIATPVPAIAQAIQAEDEDEIEISQDKFNAWLNAFRIKATQRGIQKSTLDTAFLGMKPIKKVISLDRKQPEKKLTLDEYLDNVITDARIEKGHKLLVENKQFLADISKKTGVEPEFIVALWGLESGYGANTGNFSIVKSLATLAYEGRRRDFFEDELIKALQIVEQQNLKPSDLRGSWAGAMGQCQFMPSSYLTYAVDGDGDGSIDIWNDKKDVLASIANYLATVGWGKDDATKEKALKHWNRSTYFVTSVFQLAESIK